MAKIQEKRKLKQAQELEMLIMLESKTSKLTRGQRNYIKLKKEVIDMRTDLEHHYNITQIT
jgi:hypothetical protein